MLQATSSLSEIAVLRGGIIRADESMSEGVDILRALTSRGYAPLDVVISRDGEWMLKGVPTDAHYIFTRAHTVVDTTRDKGAAHKALAKKMGIKLLLSHEDTVTMDRETMYRLLRQQGVKTPDTHVVRAAQSLEQEKMHTLWRSLHTPLLVRPLSRDHGQSNLIRTYGDFESTLRSLHEKGVDAHVLNYIPRGTLSLATLPSFRGQEVYTPLAVETFMTDKNLPRRDNPMRPLFQASQSKNEAIRSIVEKAYHALGLSGHALIDIIPYKDTYMVVNIDTEPSLHKEGRFMQSLATTGADIGEYIHAHVSYDRER